MSPDNEPETPTIHLTGIFNERLNGEMAPPEELKTK
jgi:hypothetical protein